MAAAATRYYLANYIDTFSTPDVNLALAGIPQVGAFLISFFLFVFPMWAALYVCACFEV